MAPSQLELPWASRYDMSWTSYACPGARPSTVQEISAPIESPTRSHVVSAEDQSMDAGACFTRYLAGLPVPSSTWVHRTSSDVSVASVIVRSSTTPALPAAAEAAETMFEYVASTQTPPSVRYDIN